MKKQENSKINPNITKRSLARLIAVQTVYQYSFYDQNSNIIALMNNLLDEYALNAENSPESYRDRVDMKLLHDLVINLPENISEIDDDIKKFIKSDHLEKKDLDVILAIFRVATLELKIAKSTPARVILSEYVDIAACFYDSKKVTFANSVLENLAKKIRENEFNN